MVTFFGIVLMYWGVQLLKLNEELTNFGALVAGTLLTLAGGYVFFYSFSLPLSSGAAYG